MDGRVRLFVVSLFLVLLSAPGTVLAGGSQPSAHPFAKQIKSLGSCNDRFGRQIPVVVEFDLGDVAIAQTSRKPSLRLIKVDPREMSRYSPLFRLWVHAHECGHHALGHGYTPMEPRLAEQQADCWATRALDRLGLMTPENLRRIQVQLANSGGGNRTHLPGPLRARNLAACLGDGVPGVPSRIR